MKQPKPGSAKDGESGPAPKGKLYRERLGAEGLPAEPIARQFRPVRQFQLAHLAATLAKGVDTNLSAGDLAGKAMQIWNAAGGAQYVEQQAQVVVKGLLYFDRHDWVAHCRALIASLDDSEGAVPGHTPQDVLSTAYTKAKVKAAEAVNRVWKTSQSKSDLLRALFQGAGETGESREAKFSELLAYAKQTVESGDSLPLGTKDGDPVYAALLHAWEPLAVWDDKEFMDTVILVRDMMGADDIASILAVVPFYGCVARWLTAIRQEQLSLSKKRA